EAGACTCSCVAPETRGFDSAPCSTAEPASAPTKTTRRQPLPIPASYFQGGRPGSLQESMETVNVNQLIEAGVHFGCRVSRWNPQMAPYIYGRRNLIHIIDLRETLRGILRAQNVLYHMAAEGSTILWV